MPNSSLLKEKSDTIYAIAGDDKLLHTFLQSISPKASVIARLEFELAYEDDRVQ